MRPSPVVLLLVAPYLLFRFADAIVPSGPAGPVGIGDGYEPAATLKTPVPDPEDG